MDKRLRGILTAVLAVIFLIGGWLMLRQMENYRKTDESNDLAQQLAVTTEPTAPATEETTEPTEIEPEQTEPTQPPEPMDAHSQYVATLDLAALQQVNPDVIGWIHIPDTEISYPILYGGDNETYLHVAWDGAESVAGSIFVEQGCNPDFQSFYTIVYGHHMANGSMFAGIMDYKDQAFRDSHPCIYIAVDQQIFRYEVFSAYEADITSITYGLEFSTDTQKQKALNTFVDNSVWQAEITPKIEDKVITLSTCTGTGTYDTRWVIQAVMTGSWEK